MRVRSYFILSASALALAAPARADQILGSGRIDGTGKMLLPAGPAVGPYQGGKFTATPGKLALPDADSSPLGAKEIAISRADKRFIFNNVDGTLGYGSLLNASPAGRKAVEQGDASDLTNIMAKGLDPQALSSIQISPAFCPYGQLTGTTPNDTCIQAAINYACLLSNSPATKVAGTLMFGRADYYIKFGITVPKACAGLHFGGQGHASDGGTRIISDNNCTAPIINFYNDATQNYIYGGGVSDIFFFNNKLVGGGFDGTTSCLKPLIQANFGRNMDFRRISSLSPNILTKLVGGQQLVVDDISFDQALPNSTGVFEFTGYGARADATGQLTRQDVVRLGKVIGFSAVPPTGGQFARGIWWHGFSASLQTMNTAFTTISTALKIDCTMPGVASGLQAAEIGACPAFGVFKDFETEATGANAIDITDAQSMQFDFLYAACYARTSTSTPITSGCGNVMKVKNTTFAATGGITVNGGILNGAQASGIEYEGYQLTVTGGTKLYGNDAANVGGSQITLMPPVAGKASGSHVITNNFFCSGPAANFDGKNPVNSIVGNDWVVVSGNIFRGCAGGVIGSAGSHGNTTVNAMP